MTLYFETQGGFIAWNGDAIDNVRHPLSIEQFWSTGQLETLGLFKPTSDPVPEGKIVTSSSVQRVDGVVRYVYGLEDAPPPPPPLEISDRQFFQQLAIAGIISEGEALAAVQTGVVPGVMADIVSGISDPAENFAACMLLSGATVFRRDHPLVSTFAAVQGWISDDVADFWRAAAQL